MKNTLYKIRMLMLGVFVALSFGTLAQVGGGSGISAPPTSDDPSFSTLDVTGNSTLGGTLAVTGMTDLQDNVFDSSGSLVLADSVVVTGTIDLRENIFDALGDLTISDDFIVTGTSDLQGSITNSAGDVVVADNFEISFAAPIIRWDETDAAVDNASWRIRVQNQQLQLEACNDAGSICGNVLSVDRTGATIDTLNLEANIVQINGNDVTAVTGSFLADTVGCSTELTNNTVTYFRIGIHVTVEINPNGSTCTSDSTAFSLDASVNAPAWWDPLLATGMGVVGGEFINNGSSATGVCASIDASGDIDFSRTCMGNADWTASGSKGFGSENKSFTFLLN